MFRLIAISAFAISAASPVFAQDSMSKPGSIQEAPVPQSAPSTAAPAPATSPAQDPAADKAAAVKQVVDAEFPTYDVDKSTALSKDEFGKWVTELRAKSDASQGKTEKMPEIEMAKWVSSAFAAADKDKSKKVTKDEMMAFLQG